MNRSKQVGNRAGSGGFSLLELMIVIAVLGILTVMAVSSYGSSTMKTRRGTAEGCLMEAAQTMERYYTINMTYAIPDFPDMACALDLSDYYTFGFDGVPDGVSYKVQAVPKGPQAKDTQCGTLSLTHTGEKGATEPVACW